MSLPEDKGPFTWPSQNWARSNLGPEAPELPTPCLCWCSRAAQSPNRPPAQPANLPPTAGLGTGAQLTLSGKVPADKGGVHVLQQDDALLWCHAQEVIEPVIREAAVAEAQQADTVLQLPSQGCAGKDTNHRGESQ